jgi:predicted transcriptional regulator
MNNQLARIKEDLDNGRHVPPVSTREFLSWFSAQRRGSWVVWWIRRSLNEAGLETVPDFASTYIDAQIELKLATEEESEAGLPLTSEAEDELTASSQVVAAPITVLASKDPTYRLSKLAAANRGVVSVKPDASIAECVTKMLLRDFSQLPVMTNDRDVKGTVSWKTIGYEQTRLKACFAREVMVPHHEIRASSSIFETIPLIVAHEYVLVRNDENLITGIITAADLSQQFHLLAEPFLLLSEIENLLRNIIGDCFSSAELSDARDPSETNRKVDGPAGPELW